MKDYLLKVQEHCSEHLFGQDAIAWAIATGMVTLTYDLETDTTAIAARYDEIVDAYRVAQAASQPLINLTHQLLGLSKAA